MPHHKEQGSIQHGLGLFVAAISPAHVQLPNNNHKIHADKRSKEKEKKKPGQGMGTSCQARVPAASQLTR